MKWNLLLAAGAAAALSSSIAEAAVVRYEVDLTPANRTDAAGNPIPGGGQAASMYFKIDDGFPKPLKATAGIVEYDSAVNTRLDLSSNGLGVTHDDCEGFVFRGNCVLNQESTQLDSNGDDEFIEFTIDIPDFDFRLIEATFTHVGTLDEFRLVVFDENVPGLDITDYILSQDGSVNLVTCGLASILDLGTCVFTFLDTDGGDYSFQALTGDTFRFTIPGGTDDDYRLVQVVWEIDVPEPATLGVLGLALAGLGLARRRKA